MKITPTVKVACFVDASLEKSANVFKFLLTHHKSKCFDLINLNI